MAAQELTLHLWMLGLADALISGDLQNLDADGADFFFNKLICCICRCHLSLKLASLAKWKNTYLKGSVLDERHIAKSVICSSFKEKHHGKVDIISTPGWFSPLKNGVEITTTTTTKKDPNTNVASFQKPLCQPTSICYFFQPHSPKTRHSSLELVLVVVVSVVLVLFHRESSAKCRSSIASWSLRKSTPLWLTLVTLECLRAPGAKTGCRIHKKG